MAVCPSCSSEIPAGTRWCTMCHASVTGSPEKLATPAKRLAAFLLDIAIPFIALVFIFGIAGASQSSGTGFFLFAAYALWAVYLFCRGTTPGKRMLGMRVIKENGADAGFVAMFIREIIGKFISAMIFLLGYLWILFDRERQGWHDKLASTYVVQ